MATDGPREIVVVLALASVFVAGLLCYIAAWSRKRRSKEEERRQRIERRLGI